MSPTLLKSPISTNVVDTFEMVADEKKCFRSDCCIYSSANSHLCKKFALGMVTLFMLCSLGDRSEKLTILIFYYVTTSAPVEISPGRRHFQATVKSVDRDVISVADLFKSVCDLSINWALGVWKDGGSSVVELLRLHFFI